MLTPIDVTKQLFAKNLENAKSYIKEVLKQSPWITTQAGEHLIEQMVRVVVQLPDLETRTQFAGILKELLRFFQNCNNDLQIALFTKLSQCSVSELNTLCDELPGLIIKCADTPVQPLHYVLHLPKHGLSIIRSILQIINNKERPVQEQICKLLSGFTPRAVMLLFNPDVTINSEKSSADDQRKRFISAIADLAKGVIKKISFEKLNLMLQDDQFVDLLEQQWLSLDDVSHISIEKIQFYIQLLKYKIPIDAMIVRTIFLLESFKVKLLMRTFARRIRANDPLDPQVILLIITMFAIAPDYLEPSIYQAIMLKCLDIINFIGVDLLKQTQHIKMGLVSKFVSNNERPNSPFLLYLIARLCMKKVVLPEDLLILLKTIMELYVAKKLSDVDFCAEVSSLVNNHPLLQKSSPLVKGQEELFRQDNNEQVVEQTRKWHEVQMGKSKDRQAQQSAFAPGQLTHQGQAELDNLLRDKANYYEQEQDVLVDLRGDKTKKPSQEKRADSQEEEVNNGEHTDELITPRNLPSLPGIHSFLSIANRRDQEIRESMLVRASTVPNNTCLNQYQIHSTVSLPTPSFSQGAQTLASGPDASLLSNMRPAVMNNYQQVGCGYKSPAPPSEEEGSRVASGASVFFAPAPLHNNLYPGVNLTPRTNANAPAPAKKAKIIVLPVAPNRNSSEMFQPKSPAINQTAILQSKAPAVNPSGMWQLYSLGERSTNIMIQPKPPSKNNDAIMNTFQPGESFRKK